MINSAAQLDDRSESISREFARLLRQQLGERIAQVILFGSRARGEAEEDSDYDFLVLVDRFSKELEGQIRDLAYEMLDRHGVVVSAMVVEADHFEEEKWEPLYITVRQEGIAL